MKKTAAIILSILILTGIPLSVRAFDIFYHAADAPEITDVGVSQDGETYSVSFTSSLLDTEIVRLATYDAILDFIGGEDKLMNSSYAYMASESINYCQISLDGENFITVKSSSDNDGVFTLDFYSDILIPLKNSGADLLPHAQGINFFVRAVTASKNHTDSPSTVFVYAVGESTAVTGKAFGYIEYVLPDGVSNPSENIVFFTPPLSDSTRLLSPSRTGYHFDGWETADGRIIGSIPAGTYSMKLISRWLPVTYEINYFLTTHHDPSFSYSFGRADNSNNPTEYTVGTGARILDINSPVAGFTFGGWYYEEDFSGERVTEISPTDTGVKLLYAKWISEKDEAKDRETLREEFIANGKFGDVDDDGNISSADARLILRYVVSLENIAPELIKRADYSGSGKISSADARTTLRIAVGIDDLYSVLKNHKNFP